MCQTFLHFILLLINSVFSPIKCTVWTYLSYLIQIWRHLLQCYPGCWSSEEPRAWLSYTLEWISVIVSYPASIPCFLETQHQFSFGNHLSSSPRPYAWGGTDSSGFRDGYRSQIWPIEMVHILAPVTAHVWACSKARVIECRSRPVNGKVIPFLHRMAPSWELVSYWLVTSLPCRKTLPTESRPGAGQKDSWTPPVCFWSHPCQKLDSRVTYINLFSLKPGWRGGVDPIPFLAENIRFLTISSWWNWPAFKKPSLCVLQLNTWVARKRAQRQGCFILHSRTVEIRWVVPSHPGAAEANESWNEPGAGVLGKGKWMNLGEWLLQGASHKQPPLIVWAIMLALRGGWRLGRSRILPKWDRTKFLNFSLGHKTWLAQRQKHLHKCSAHRADSMRKFWKHHSNYPHNSTIKGPAGRHSSTFSDVFTRFLGSI